MSPAAGATGTALWRLLAAERCLLRYRAGPPDPAAAVAAALLAACGTPVPAPVRTAGARIAARVAAFGAAFADGCEPAYHDRHHTADATLAAGWLARAAREAGTMDAQDATRCVLAMAGHDLLHPGRVGQRPGQLEEISAAETIRLAHDLPHEDLRAIHRLILVTDPAHPPPTDLPGRLVREADLFASLTPTLGWRLSEALAAERRTAGVADAAITESFKGRLGLLRMIPAFSLPAVALGLESGRAVQLAAMTMAGGAADPADGAAALDAMPRDAAHAAYRAACHASLAAAGMGEATA